MYLIILHGGLLSIGTIREQYRKGKMKKIENWLDGQYLMKKLIELENTIMLLNLKLEHMTLKTDALYDSILKNNAIRRKKKAKK